MSAFNRTISLLSLASALCTLQARAQLSDPLAAAEQAYRDVDFEAQEAQVRRALEAGNNDRTRLTQLYRLLGIAQAARGDQAAARESFLRLLALDPEVELERALSPRVRSPYLEARGFWDVTPTRLGVDVLSRESRGDLQLSVRDPIGMAARVRVTCMAIQPQAAIELEASELILVTSRELAPHWAKPLRIELLDEHGNVIHARLLPATRVTSSDASLPGPALKERSPTADIASPGLDYPSLVIAGTGVVALGLGVLAHVVRENKALEWNSAACERSGLGTRGRQCAEVNADRSTAQRLAVASYSAGGALLAAALVVHFIVRGSEEERPPIVTSGATACGSGPGLLGLTCGGAW